MTRYVLRTGASPVYEFLSFMQASLADGEHLTGKRILECGAGGALPPLVLFAQHDLMTFGIDVSEEQIALATQFANRNALSIHLQRGDMRCIPFAADYFDYAYEHYSMCHLTHADTAQTVQEMLRVLKPGGLAFLGVISTDTWPLSMLGEEREPGEYWTLERGESICHSVFNDEDADRLVVHWNLLAKKKSTRYVGGDDLTEEDWVALHAQTPEPCSLDQWNSLYPSRQNLCRYAHLYYFLRKPSE